MDDRDRELDGFYDPEILAAIDAWEPVEPDPVPAPLPSRMTSWSRKTAMGAVLTGFALGIQEVLDPEEERAIVIEVDASGEPRDLPIQLILDPDSPVGSLCIVHRSDVPPPVV